MTRPNVAPAVALPVSSRFLPVLPLLFVGSGCAALIYEIVWFQLVELVIGSSAVSLGVLLGTFMGGMCLGSLLAAAIRCHRARIRCASTPRSRRASASSACWSCSACRRSAISIRRFRPAGSSASCCAAIFCGDLPAGADDVDGRHAAGDGAVGGGDAHRRVVARVLLRQQHRRCGGRLRAGRVLPAAGFRHG